MSRRIWPFEKISRSGSLKDYKALLFKCKVGVYSRLYIILYSRPTIPPLSGLAKKRRYWKTAVKGVIRIYNQEKTHSGLTNQRRYWGGCTSNSYLATPLTSSGRPLNSVCSIATPAITTLSSTQSQLLSIRIRVLVCLQRVSVDLLLFICRIFKAVKHSIEQWWGTLDPRLPFCNYPSCRIHNLLINNCC